LDEGIFQTQSNESSESKGIKKVWLIELNPFYETTDGCLYSWKHDWGIITGSPMLVFVFVFAFVLSSSLSSPLSLSIFIFMLSFLYLSFVFYPQGKKAVPISDFEPRQQEVLRRWSMASGRTLSRTGNVNP
jgi:hypothetical protein